MSTSSDAADERASGLDRAGYWLTVLGIYFLVGVLFFYSGKGKLFDDNGHAPEAMKKQFEGTFIDTVPGIDTAWVMIGILEFGIFLLMLLSNVRGEFLLHRRKSLLLVALALTLLNFACLSFGQTSTGNNQGTASLYSYFGSTAVVFLLALKLPSSCSSFTATSTTRHRGSASASWRHCSASVSRMRSQWPSPRNRGNHKTNTSRSEEDRRDRRHASTGRVAGWAPPLPLRGRRDCGRGSALTVARWAER